MTEPRRVTAESLRRDRERREDDRRKLADDYERAAVLLDDLYPEHRAAARLLHREAERWRR